MSDGCPWCGYTGSGSDPAHTAHRIDPPDCGCTDCILHWSVPESAATAYELNLMRCGIVQDATGRGPEPWNPEAAGRPRVTVDVEVTRPVADEIADLDRRIAALRRASVNIGETW